MLVAGKALNGAKGLRLKNLTHASGSDSLGAYDSTIMAFQVESSDISIVNSIKVYEDGAYIAFEESFPLGVDKTGTTGLNSSSYVSMFPSFSNMALDSAGVISFNGHQLQETRVLSQSTYLADPAKCSDL